MYGRIKDKPTRKQREYLFFRDLMKDYHDSPEAMQFIDRLSKKARHNRKIRRILSR